MTTEQTEKASPQKKKKAAEQGDRLMSREFITAVAMLCGVLTFRIACRRWLIAWIDAYHSSIVLLAAANHSGISPEGIASSCRTIAIHCLITMLVCSMSGMIGALVTGVIQGGGSVTAALIIPRLSRINPSGHIKNIFGLQAVIRTAKSLVPAAVVLGIATTKFRALRLNPCRSLKLIPILCRDIYDLLLVTSLVMLLWSVVDYVSAWRTREGRLKMSKQDVRDETKQSEGSPQVKRRIRHLQRQMRKRQLRGDVSKATVVLTNPTHYAVALKFDFIQMEPPKVLAKGRNLVAQQIREDAQWAGIPIVENPPLARSLFRGVDVGQSIPFDLYAAVAGILAYLYRKEMDVKRRLRVAGMAETDSRSRRPEEDPVH